MTERVSEAAPGARMEASVKWYDAAKGFGFLEPGGGLPDIFCHASVLEAVGLDMLLDGATVACEVVQGDQGPQAVRIHAVDFSTAIPVSAPGNGRTAMDREPPRPDASSAEDPMEASVKWFMPTKAYGFLECLDGSGDVFCHLSVVVQASGRETLPQGATVTCEVATTERGRQVSRILAVDAPVAGDAAEANGQPWHGTPDRAWQDNGPPGIAVDIHGTVKFYDAAKGFGFIVPDDARPEVFVHASALSRSGLDELLPGQRISVRAEQAPRGLQATEVQLLE